MSRGPRAAEANRNWGTDEDGCSILHVDMDAFFASVELARRPHLRGYPVIVGGGERGVVLAATYEARAFGVHSAMSMSRALHLCPKATVLPADGRLYAEVSRSVFAILQEITPLVEPLSIDEAFLDVSGARRRLGPATRIGAQLRAQVQAVHNITCSVGIARTKFVAKLASTHAKPDGLMLIPGAATIDFLHSLPVGALWGVGEKTQETLARWGITTVRELAQSDVLVIQAAVGKVAGAHLHNLSWGRDPRPVHPGKSEHSIGAQSTFGRDTVDVTQIQNRLLELSDRCATRLRRHGYLARTVTATVRTSDFHTVTRSRVLASPTDVAHELYLVARDLVAGVDLHGLAIRLVGVRAEGLVRRESAPVQPTLDEAVTAQMETRRRAESAIDDVRERFGKESISMGAAQRRLTTTAAEVDLS